MEGKYNYAYEIKSHRWMNKCLITQTFKAHSRKLNKEMTKHCWKKIKDDLNKNIHLNDGLEDLLILRYKFFPNLSIDSVHSSENASKLIGKIW